MPETDHTVCVDQDCLDCHPIDGPAVDLETALAGHHVAATS